ERSRSTVSSPGPSDDMKPPPVPTPGGSGLRSAHYVATRHWCASGILHDRVYIKLLLTSGEESMLVPKVGRARIDTLDVLRGIAILLIFVLNIPLMGNPLYPFHADPRLLGWSPADQSYWWFQSIALAGTQRGILQLLFGAGAVILLERTMRRDGPVEVADLYFRRNL